MRRTPLGFYTPRRSPGEYRVDSWVTCSRGEELSNADPCLSFLTLRFTSKRSSGVLLAKNWSACESRLHSYCARSIRQLTRHLEKRSARFGESESGSRSGLRRSC